MQGFSLKPFLSSDICLSCQGCCQFDKKESDWRPKVGLAEAHVLVGVCSEKEIPRPQPITDQRGYIQDRKCHGLFTCIFLNPEDRMCRIYHDRPLECRLYPFVLTLTDQRPSLSVHLTCPFVRQNKETKMYMDYVAYLRAFFTNPDLKSFLNENPHLFGRYTGYEKELERLFYMTDIDYQG